MCYENIYTGNHVIKSVNLVDRKVDTLVGTHGENGRKDGIGKETTFSYPYGLALDSISNFLYVADGNNHSIRRILLAEKRVETLCGNEIAGLEDGSFEEARFYYPIDVAWNSKMQELYVSDSWNHIIRVISLRNKTVKTLCGTPWVKGYKNGISTQTKFNYPTGLGLDINSQNLYVSDKNTIRKISLLGEVRVDALCGIPKVEGNKSGFFPTFSHPSGIVVDPHSHSLYVMDSCNHKVKKLIKCGK